MADVRARELQVAQRSLQSAQTCLVQVKSFCSFRCQMALWVRQGVLVAQNGQNIALKYFHSWFSGQLRKSLCALFAGFETCTREQGRNQRQFYFVVAWMERTFGEIGQDSRSLHLLSAGLWTFSRMRNYAEQHGRTTFQVSVFFIHNFQIVCRDFQTVDRNAMYAFVPKWSENAENYFQIGVHWRGCVLLPEST